MRAGQRRAAVALCGVDRRHGVGEERLAGRRLQRGSDGARAAQQRRGRRLVAAQIRLAPAAEDVGLEPAADFLRQHVQIGLNARAVARRGRGLQWPDAVAESHLRLALQRAEVTPRLGRPRRCAIECKIVAPRRGRLGLQSHAFQNQRAIEARLGQRRVEPCGMAAAASDSGKSAARRCCTALV